MITVVCWLFQGHGITSGGKPVTRDYGPGHVNRFVRLIDTHLHQPHRVICLMDKSYPVACEAIQHPSYLNVLPKGYRKLWVFSEECTELLGRGARVLVSDLDVCVVGELDTLLGRDETFVAWHDTQSTHTGYSSGNYLFTTGCRQWLWDDFSLPATQQMQEALTQRYGKATGSDMAWMSYKLADEATFGPGIYRARRIPHGLPKDARIIHFSGTMKPWHAKAQKLYSWIKEHEPS